MTKISVFRNNECRRDPTYETAEFQWTMVYPNYQSTGKLS